MVTTKEEILIALDGGTGNAQWEVQLAKGSRYREFWEQNTSTVASSGGVVFTGSIGKVFYALDTSDGSVKWEFGTGGEVLCTPALTQAGQVVLGSYDGKIYALDQATGLEAWSFATGGAVYSSPAIGADKKVYIGSGDGYLYALAGDTGEVIWQTHLSNGVKSSPALGGDQQVFVCNDLGNLYALDANTGRIDWRFDTDKALVLSPSSNPNESFVSSPVVDSRGTVYVGSQDSVFWAVDSATGYKKWSYDTPWFTYGSPAIGADGKVYVPSWNLDVIDGRQGTFQYSIPGSSWLSTPVLGEDGTLYASTWEWSQGTSHVYAFKASSSPSAMDPWPQFHSMGNRERLSSGFTFELVEGGGDTGNESFRIISNRLEVASSFLAADPGETSIRVAAKHSDGSSLEKAFPLMIEEPNQLFHQVYNDSMDLGHGWFQSPWLGIYYRGERGFLYQEHLGWVYPMAVTWDFTYLYHPVFGWFSTNPNLFPIMYNYDRSSWVAYNTVSLHSFWWTYHPENNSWGWGI